MDTKNFTEVYIAGKVYNVGGFEEEEYLQKVAAYVNSKVNELREQPGFLKMNADYQNVLLELNLADDIFKMRRQAMASDRKVAAQEKENYNIRHDLVSSQMKLDNMKEHLESVQQEQEDTRTELESVKQQYENSQSELKSMEQQYESSQKELKSAKQQLAASQKEMENARQQLESSQRDLENTKKQLKDVLKALETETEARKNAEEELNCICAENA